VANKLRRGEWMRYRRRGALPPIQMRGAGLVKKAGPGEQGDHPRKRRRKREKENLAIEEKGPFPKAHQSLVNQGR